MNGQIHHVDSKMGALNPFKINDLLRQLVILLVFKLKRETNIFCGRVFHADPRIARFDALYMGS
jgi:hypothetical protein